MRVFSHSHPPPTAWGRGRCPAEGVPGGLTHHHSSLRTIISAEKKEWLRSVHWGDQCPLREHGGSPLS